MSKTNWWFLPLIGLALAGAAAAQSAESARFYKLDFTLKELEGGKTVNSRVFTTMLAVQSPGTERPIAVIRAGARVPVQANPGSTQFSYRDVGVNIDARELREAQGEVSMYITADISTIAPDTTPGAEPVLRQNKWSGTVIVPAKKGTTVFASDDMSSKRQLALEVTATPVK